MNKYTCHSGGCAGADMFWENEGFKYGVKTIAYSFYNHKQDSKNQKILTVDELNEGFLHVMIANKILKRYPQGQPRYIQNLLARNWYQVLNSEAVFAIGKFKTKTIIDGGTGWAVQMSIDNNKPVFFFDQPTNCWYRYLWDNHLYGVYTFEPVIESPKLSENFAGIGTRELTDNGKKAIIEVYKHTFA